MNDIENYSIKLYLADRFFLRLKGLLGRKTLTPYEGMLISPCNQVHTFFMKFTIDVVFIDRNFKVVAVEECMKPGKISGLYKNAVYTLEVLGGTNKLIVGDTITITEGGLFKN